ncbi:testis-expressed protein 52-like [Lineus longissimus]|uniref:testis-expressed protein 52-like n=1 Tax=Lineus longissimus TaxID=88925 RepID=UPI00315CC284
MAGEVETSIPTLYERETLMRDVRPKYTGFTPRPVERLATRRRPHTMLDIECRHVLRSEQTQSAHLYKPMEYMLWLEAAKHTAPTPERPDPDYNSNVWRNFRKSYGFSKSADDRTVTEMIATMYPLNIPKPSIVGDHTFDKYVNESKLFDDDKKKKLAIQRSKTDIEEFRRLRLRTEARNPPMDEDGNILPPKNFKKYIHRFIPPDNEEPPLEEIPSDLKPDMFGNFRKVKTKPILWKLGYNLNNPEFMQVQDEIQKRRAQPRQFPPVLAVKKPPTWKYV